MCEYPNLCVSLLTAIGIPIFTALCGVGMGLIPYFTLNKKDKLQNSSDISKVINAKFTSYKTKLGSYIEQAKTQKDTLDFTELTNEFEELIGHLTDACEKLLNNALPKTSQNLTLSKIRKKDFRQISITYKTHCI